MRRLYGEQLKKAVHLFLFALFCLFLMIFTGCAKAGTGEKFIISENGLPASLDPQFESGRGGASLCTAIYAGLLRFNGNDGLVCDCAERYEVSTDLKTITFYLRDGLVWSDGTPLTSADFAFGLRRSLAPETDSVFAAELLAIQGAEEFHQTGSGSLGLNSSDPKVLIIKLSRPDHGMITALASPYAAPCKEEFFVSTGGQYGLTLKTSLTNGRFTPTGMDSSITVIKNKHFYDAEHVNPASITFYDSSLETPEGVVKKVENGEIDVAVIGSLPYMMPQNVKAISLKGSSWMLSFGDSDPVTADHSFRKALAIGGLSLAQAEKNTGFFLPPQYRQDILTGAGKVRSTDIPAAKLALQETLTVLQKTKLPKITLLVPQREDARILSDLLIEKWQQQLGVYISREFVEQEDLDAKLSRGQYQLAITLFKPSITSPASFYESMMSNFDLIEPSFLSQYKELLSKSQGDQAKLSASMEELFFQQDKLFPLAYGETFYIKNDKAFGDLYQPSGGGIDLSQATK